jgi:hypothetical protein
LGLFEILQKDSADVYNVPICFALFFNKASCVILEGKAYFTNKLSILNGAIFEHYSCSYCAGLFWGSA